MKLTYKLLLFIILIGNFVLIQCGTKDATKVVDKANKVGKETGQPVPIANKEKMILQRIFGSSLDISKINFVYNSALSLGSTRTIKNTIHFAKKNNITSNSYRTSKDFYILLVHESTHAWQYQNIGLRYIPDSFYNQAKGYIIHKSRGEAYKYQLIKNKSFKKYSSEQQAMILQEYFSLKIFNYKPWRCKNFPQIKKSTFLKIIENLIKNDINPRFKPGKLRGLQKILINKNPV